MKPTPTMFNRLRLQVPVMSTGKQGPGPAVGPPVTPPKRPVPLPDRPRRKVEVDREPGHVAVQVTGADEGAAFPLGGLRVRASSGGETIEGVTNVKGHAVLPLDAAGRFEVEVLAPSGEVVGRSLSRAAPGRPVTVEIAVRKHPDLENSFAEGRVLSQEIRRHAERIDTRRQSETVMLEQRITALEATVARLERAAAALEKGNVSAGNADKPPPAERRTTRDRMRKKPTKKEVSPRSKGRRQ